MPHTPGPWHDDGYRIYAPTTDQDKRNGRVIVEYKHVHDFNYADAWLIAVAPKLLDACKLALQVFAEGEPVNECLKLLEDVIDEAEGRR